MLAINDCEKAAIVRLWIDKYFGFEYEYSTAPPENKHYWCEFFVPNVHRSYRFTFLPSALEVTIIDKFCETYPKNIETKQYASVSTLEKLFSGEWEAGHKARRLTRELMKLAAMNKSAVEAA